MEQQKDADPLFTNPDDLISPKSDEKNKNIELIKNYQKPDQNCEEIEIQTPKNLKDIDKL